MKGLWPCYFFFISEAATQPPLVVGHTTLVAACLSSWWVELFSLFSLDSEEKFSPYQLFSKNMLTCFHSICLPFADLKCPVCSKIVPSDEADVHLIMCLTRPRITYNDDVLTEDKGECAICLEDMSKGSRLKIIKKVNSLQFFVINL